MVITILHVGGFKQIQVAVPLHGQDSFRFYPDLCGQGGQWGLKQLQDNEEICFCTGLHDHIYRECL